MAIQTCPSAMVEAPADRVWQLLTTRSGLESWSGVKMVQGPDGPLTTGDRMVFRAGPSAFFEIRFEVMGMERLRRLVLDVYFPFGIVNHEAIIITPHSENACRVTYN